MNKFYIYLLPVILLTTSFSASAYLNNEFIFYCGWIVSLIWLNRVANQFQNKIFKILTLVIFIVTMIWTIGLLITASAW